METKTQNPIAALRRAMRYAHSGWPHEQAFEGCASKLCTDARAALARVEAVVEALQWVERNISSAKQIKDVLAPFAKEGS